MEKEQKETLYRHSMSHVLAKALHELYSNVKFAIGPAVANGFYYDVDVETSITPEYFEKIENKMREIINKNEAFTYKEVSRQEAQELFSSQPYKLELINEFPENEKISIYYLGSDFFDLCRGPHIENTKMLRGYSFKLNKAAGAYWKGDSNNKMLQRIYGLGFLEKADMKAYLYMMEEAIKRDHRKLGKELDLFFISDYSKGMPTYTPNGLTLKNKLVEYWREVHKKAGYKEIETPIALNKELWEISGHWDHYKDNMYTFKVEDETFAIKPMNCPGGILYYQEKGHSYKEFPLRIGELGKVHRHEASGTLSGLLRARCFTQDDAHVFMTPDQISSEIKNIMKLIDEVYSTFGLSYKVELSTMPEDHIGKEEEWQYAEKSLEITLKSLNMDYKINKGDGAFYGPKIDVHVTDSIGREWQCGTIQLDMQLPKRFNLTYINNKGEEKEPVMVHRVVYGSLERIMAILIENYAGAFPVWLAPVQIKVLNVNENSEEYAKFVASQLDEQEIRTELDIRNESINKKIRDSQLMKIPYIAVVGEKEKQSAEVSIREFGSKNQTLYNLKDFIEKVKMEDKNRINTSKANKHL